MAEDPPSPYRFFKVLVVDDNNYARKLADFALKKIGFQSILLCNSVDKALEVLKNDEYTEKVDLIISDWNMPEKTGLDFFEITRQNESLSEIPFLMLTGVTGAESVKDAYEKGVKYYVIKPFTEVGLKEKIDIIFADKIGSTP